jgi:malate synthase
MFFLLCLHYKIGLMETEVTNGIEIKAQVSPAYAEVLTPGALAFLVKLHRNFNAQRLQLLAKRVDRQHDIDNGILPDFLPETKEIRTTDWVVAPLPADLLDRRVEITGPVDRKMVINGLNAGTQVYMADFEDSNSPTFGNCLDGQINLRDAIAGTITYSNGGKEYKLNEKVAVLKVRPRGWHLNEKHIYIDGEIASGSLTDFGLFFYHNAKALIAKGSGPYFYLPKLESHLEARLWNDVFVFAQNELGIPQGTIKATVLIETILAAFEMDEILYELRQHSAGLNCGRWDYIFSYIKKFQKRPEFTLPERAQVTMTVHFMSSYSQLVIKTCHRRNVHAMGGMAAQIPIKNDEDANTAALAKVRADKEREAQNGHDGTWVAHPGLVAVAKEVFDKYMPTPNQIANKRLDVEVNAADLLQVPAGTITLAGFKNNIDVSIQYIEAWLRGSGCVPIYNLMEDAATAEISRAQVWQWLHNGAKLDDGTVIEPTLFNQTVAAAVEQIKALVGEEKYAAGKYNEATAMFVDLATAPVFSEFLTLNAYNQID